MYYVNNGFVGKSYVTSNPTERSNVSYFVHLQFILKIASYDLCVRTLVIVTMYYTVKRFY